MGVSGASVCIQDIWAQYHNQAALASLQNISVGVAFQNSFFVKELSTKSISFVLPVKYLVFGVNYYYFGYNKLNENKIGLSFAKKLGKKISFGGQIDYFFTHIDGEYENKATAVGELGVIAEPINNLFIAAHVFNVWNTQFSSYENQYMPNITKIGISYMLQNQSTLNIEVEKEVDEELIVKTGAEIYLIDKLVLRAGVAGKPLSYSFGLGYSYKPLQLNIAFSKHHILGYSPFISVVYDF